MKFFVSTGEASGDLHLSYLVEEIKKNNKEVEFYGVAGEKSRKVGVSILQDIDEIAVMGFTGILSKYKFLKNKANEYIEFIKENQIKNIILIDYGGFNLKFLKLLRKEIEDIKIFYYIPPKLWIWGEGRIKILKMVDHIVVIFPWEVDFYKKYLIDAVYFGNPFTDIYKKSEVRGKKILLLPGSRIQEIKRIVPIFKEIMEKNFEDKYILKLNSESDLKYLDEIKKLKNLEIIFDESLETISKEINLAVAISGTVTLELALLGVPTIVVYKTNFLNYFIAKYILKLKYVSLPNLTIDEEVFPELLQGNCKTEIILGNIKNINFNRREIEQKLEKVRKKLDGESVIKNYANFFVKEGK